MTLLYAETTFVNKQGVIMVLFEQYARQAHAIGRIGDEVRADALATNTPISYTEPSHGRDVIREYPDGRRELVKSDGSVVPVAPLGL